MYKLTYEDLEAIRELLSQLSCSHERETFYHDCCEAGELVNLIDTILKEKDK